MEHVAILKPQWLSKILSGEKTIESRWYKSKKAPYKGINSGDIVYFKETGKPVTAKAVVKDALFFDSLNEAKVKGILQKYSSSIGIIPSSFPLFFDKKYCTLVFLKNVESIAPFDINKKGFGNMAAWLTLDSVDSIRL